MSSSSRAFVTVITRSYLPFARVLAESLRQFHDETLYVICVDPVEGYFDPSREPFTTLALADVVPEQDRALLFYYNAFEACNALKAYAHNYLLRHTDHDRWIYLDSDILVTGSLSPAFDFLGEARPGLLTPHCLSPAPTARLDPLETTLQRYGVFNGGFLALRRSDEAANFIDWFVERLRFLCFRDYRNVFVDQLWLNLVPIHFDSFAIWRDPGANVAYWNLHERAVSRHAGEMMANGVPLLFLHFSRWRQDDPLGWQQHMQHAAGSDAGLLEDAGRDYCERLARAGYSECAQWPYGFDCFRTGRRITTGMRRCYYERLMAAEALSGNPFDHPDWFSVFFEVSEWCRDLKDKARGVARPLAMRSRLLDALRS